MSRSYQPGDAHIVDYKLFSIPGVRGSFRAPEPSNEEYLVCIGASQTFGRFVETPFPQLISNALAMDVLNLGRGGIGPEYYVSEPRLMERIDRARVVIVQVLSGRSQSNSLFQTVDYGMCGINLMTGHDQRADEFYTWLQSQDIDLARRVVAETRNNYVLAMCRLLDSIGVPKILLWFSERSPDCVDRWDLPRWRLCQKFPQFVNREMMNRLTGSADIYLEVVSNRGLPQKLFDQSGNPAPFMGADGVLKTENNYYPSPEMHEDAAELLIPACRDLIRRGTTALIASDASTKLPDAGM